MAKPFWVYSDFDGTITFDDNQVALLNAFGRDNWRDLENTILAGGGKSRQYLPVIYQDFRAKSTNEILDFLHKNVCIDPHFPEFARYCQANEVPLEIISDGMHFYIEEYLRRTGLTQICYYSNLVSVNPSGLDFTHPHANLECGKCGTCKKKIVEGRKAKGYFIVYVGDGVSDECAASVADLIYAKGKLACYCAKEQLPFIPYESFADILSHFQQVQQVGGEF